MPQMTADMEALRSYITYDSGIQNKGESTVLLEITHSNLKAKFMQIRLDMHMSILTVKQKLMTHCGTNPSAMVLQLKDEHGNLMMTMSDEGRPLGFYSPYDGCATASAPTPGASRCCHGSTPLRCRAPPAPQVHRAHRRHGPLLRVGQRLAGGHLQGGQVRDVGRGLQQAREHVPTVRGGEAQGRPGVVRGEGDG
mmetsp:Transcript_4889/g.12550  ORF Transcript_4889/g.12550 Transcript_4889/m.12550 type:complete len:195 (+) Transcript_4889:259-843(+)